MTICIGGAIPTEHYVNQIGSKLCVYKLKAGVSVIFFCDDNRFVIQSVPEIGNQPQNVIFSSFVRHTLTNVDSDGYYGYEPEADCYLLMCVRPDDIQKDNYPIIFNSADYAKLSSEGWSYNPYSQGIFTKFDVGTGITQTVVKLNNTVRNYRKTNISGENVNVLAPTVRSKFYNSDSFGIAMFGDSITWAASNAGLQNAFRKYVPMHFGVPQTYGIYVSGTTFTDGYGSEWASGAGTGVSGMKAVITQTPGVGDAAKVCIVELGTNDFWEQAPIGSYGDTSTETMYGAIEEFIRYVREDYFGWDIPILFVTPAKMDSYDGTTAQRPIPLMDYIYAIKDVALYHQHTYVLDMYDKWYLNYDDTKVRQKAFLDSVHWSGWAHRQAAHDMISMVSNILAVEGF